MADVNDNYLAPFPRRFRLLIDETRTSQQEIADFVGVSRQAVAQWKDGKTIPDIYNFKKVEEFFNVPYEYLLGETDSKVRANMTVAAELGLSDNAVERLHSWAAAAKENKTDIPRSEVISDLLACDDFERFIDCVRKFISEYLGHRFYEDEQSGNEGIEIADSLVGTSPYEIDQYARTIGYRAINAQDFSDLFRHQALEALGQLLSVMPEEYWVAYRLENDSNAE